MDHMADRIWTYGAHMEHPLGLLFGAGVGHMALSGFDRISRGNSTILTMKS